MGLMTGMKASSCSALTTLGSMDTMSPTWPMSCSMLESLLSTILSFCARIIAPSRPVSPTAVPPPGLAPGLVDQAHDVLLPLAGEHPLDLLHGLGVGHAHALDEHAFLAQAIQCRLDLGPPAMNHHRVNADQFEQHHIFCKVGLQRRVGHRVATVFDH